MRSFARREYGSHSIRPRGVSWMNRGTGTYSLRMLTPRTPSSCSWIVVVIVIVRMVVIVIVVVVVRRAAAVRLRARSGRSRCRSRRPLLRVRRGTRAPFHVRHQSVPPPAHHSVRARAAPSRASAPCARPAAATSASTSSSLAVMSSCATTARSARSASTARAAPTRISSMNACGSWPVISRYCSSVAPWCDSRCARSSTRRRVSLSTSVGGRLDRHEIGRGFEHLVAQRHLRLQPLHRLDAACGCRRAARRRSRTRSPPSPTRR